MELSHVTFLIFTVFSSDKVDTTAASAIELALTQGAGTR
jgi:hypothetical protein